MTNSLNGACYCLCSRVVRLSARNWGKDEDGIDGDRATVNSDEKKDTASAQSSPDIVAEEKDQETGLTSHEIATAKGVSTYLHPWDRWIVPVKPLSWLNPTKLWNWFKYITLRGVSIDVLSHSGGHIQDVHARANRYDLRTEHLFTYCQVASAILMSIAHGSNDIANAIGPISASYATYMSGVVDTESDSPIWMLVLGGALLGIGFWFYGYNVVRALGNKITQMSPSRGFTIELGAAITVLLASRLALPVSTTQCLTGATIGVALMNYDLKAVNWRQVAFIFSSWVLTLPIAGLISGLLCVMALNAPSF